MSSHSQQTPPGFDYVGWLESDTSRFLTVQQFADRLALSPTTVRRAIQDRRVRTVRLRAGGAVRIPTVELRRMLGVAPEQREAALRPPEPREPRVGGPGVWLEGGPE
jgi:excisionase family DNA binding protein